jgi:hypothetical protein
MRLRTPGRRRPSVLFAGQSYYHAWYLSRELRKLGWRADVLNWDVAPDAQGFYHAVTPGTRSEMSPVQNQLRELRADLSARAVMALEALARIDLPIEELTGDGDQAAGADELSEHDLSELFLGKTQRARSTDKGKKAETLVGESEHPATTRGN